MADVTVINPIARSTDKLKMAAYCRVSSDSADQRNSYIAQVDYYTKYIGENAAWELADIYADFGLTGTGTDRRDEFQRMMRDCRKGRVDKILVKSVTRFARNTRDCLEYLRELKSIGVTVLFEEQHIDTSTTDEIFISMQGSIAQEESLSISGNMRWSYKRRMERGEFITCCAPFGYRLKNRNLYVVESEAAVVRRIFAEYLAGKGTNAIAAEFNSEGIPFRNGKVNWRHENVANILKNEKYSGNVILQKRYTTDTLPFKQKYNHGEKMRYYVENSHPAIVSKSDFDTAQRLLIMRRPQSEQQSPHPFRRRIICNECGSTFKRRVWNDIVYWVCRAHNENAAKCSIRQIPETEIYAAFVRLWNTLQRHGQTVIKPLIAGRTELQTKLTISDTRLIDVNREIAELNEQNLVLSRLRQKEYIDSALFIEQTQQNDARLADLKRRRGHILDADGDNTIELLQTLLNITDGAERIETFNEMCFESVVDKIIVDSREQVRFRLLGGVELAERITVKERCK